MRRKFSKYSMLILLLLSGPAYADVDISTTIEAAMEQAQKSGIDMPTKDTISMLQGNITDLANGDLSNIAPDMVKDVALKGFSEGFSALKLDDKIPSSLANAVNGTGSNPLLRDAAKKEYTVSRRSGEDAEKVKARDNKVNEQMIANVSAIYARGLVRRYQLDNEKEEEFKDTNSISGAQSVYLSTLYTADSRWITLIREEANLINQTAVMQLKSLKPDDEAEEDKDKDKEKSKKEGTEGKADAESGDGAEAESDGKDGAESGDGAEAESDGKDGAESGDGAEAEGDGKDSVEGAEGKEGAEGTEGTDGSEGEEKKKESKFKKTVQKVQKGIGDAAKWVNDKSEQADSWIKRKGEQSADWVFNKTSKDKKKSEGGTGDAPGPMSAE